MIVLDLCCSNSHRFEAWFASSADFDAQREHGLVSCPVCGTLAVRRMPSAPRLRTHSAASAPETSSYPSDGSPQVLVARVVAALRQLAHGAEDVGRRFPEEARRIHYEENNARSIRGKASRDELEDLIDEGIAVLPVPPDGDLH
ncbi:MAG: DUF1178 family protein [Azoarcus sp.]|nr:DUF1178 family protein [Azoarcus sp.]